MGEGSKVKKAIINIPQLDGPLSIEYHERGGGNGALIAEEAFEICFNAAAELQRRGLNAGELLGTGGLRTISAPREEPTAYPAIALYVADTFHPLVRDYLQNPLRPMNFDTATQACMEASQRVELDPDAFSFLKARKRYEVPADEQGLNGTDQGGPGARTSRTTLIVSLARAGDKGKQQATERDLQKILNDYKKEGCQLEWTMPRLGIVQFRFSPEMTFKRLNNIQAELERRPQVAVAMWEVPSS